MPSPGKTRNIAIMGLFVALSLIFGYIEHLIPFDFGVPGIKIGLANLCCVCLLYALGPVYALAVNLVRIIISGFLFGNLSMIIYSLAGAALSFICMIAVKKTGRLSAAGVSIVGGVTHNIGQVVIAFLLFNTYGLIWYIPALIVSGAIAGALIGYITVLILPQVRKILENE